MVLKAQNSLFPFPITSLFFLLQILRGVFPPCPKTRPSAPHLKGLKFISPFFLSTSYWPFDFLWAARQPCWPIKERKRLLFTRRGARPNTFTLTFFLVFTFAFIFFQLSRLFDKARGRYFHILRYMTDLGKAFTIENVGLKNG